MWAKLYKKILWILLTLCLLTACQSSEIGYRLEILQQFSTAKMSNEAGALYTNYLQDTEIKAWGTGHQILLESIGLQLLNLNQAGNIRQFESLYLYGQQRFKMPNELYRWRLLEQENQLTEVNATIDDLRLAEALMAYEKRYGSDQYYGDIYNISYGLLKHCLEGEILLHSNVKDGLAELSYFKLRTLLDLVPMNPQWRKVYMEGLGIVQKGYIGDDFPFYYKTYDVESKSYLEQQEINMIDSLLVVLHLSEINQVRPETLNWLENQLKLGNIYNTYSNVNFQRSTDLESPAVYSLIYWIGKNTKQRYLEQEALKHLLKMQNTNQASEFYGAFADEAKQQVYSFDLLLAESVFLEALK